MVRVHQGSPKKLNTALQKYSIYSIRLMKVFTSFTIPKLFDRLDCIKLNFNTIKAVRKIFMPLKHIFPLSLYHSNITLPINGKNKIVEYILKYKSKEDYKRYREETFSWTGDQEGQGDLHKLQIFEFFFKQIKKKIYDYLDLLFIDYSQFDIYFQRSWATVSNTKEFIGRHNHAQSHLSFAYYLQKDVGDSKIIFWDNNKHNEFIPELFNSPTIKSKNIIKKKDMTNSSQATINP